MASSGNPAPRASWKALGLDFGSMLASILAFKMAWRPVENDIKNKSDFKTILGPWAAPVREGSAVSRSAVKAYPGGFRPGKS